MQLTFLGTSCMIPTKERGMPSIFFTYKDHGILFDCGEGTQRQLKIAGIKLPKITKILISHWHGDHVLGLPGLLMSLGASQYTKTLDIYGPKGTQERIADITDRKHFDVRINIRVHEITNTIIDDKDFLIETRTLDHPVPCNGYAFIEKNKHRININKLKQAGIKEGPHLAPLQEGKPITINGKKIMPDDYTTLIVGKKITFITDTKLCNNCYILAENADLLISDATYTSQLQQKAEDHDHLTAQEAALVASKSHAKKLVLTHFSARYKNTLDLQQDAQTIFDNVTCAEDFTTLTI